MEEAMNKKELGIVAGLATIVGALTAASRTKKWQEVHTFAVVAGGVVTILSVIG